MTTKTLVRLAGALGVVVVLWLLAVLLRSGGDELPRGTVVGPVVAEQVDRVEILGAADSIVFARSGNGWLVNGFAGDTALMREFLTSLGMDVTGEIVAQSSSSHARMGVVDSAAKRLRVLRGGEAVVDLFVGNRGRAYQTAYARKVEDDTVYLLEGELIGAMDRTVTAWRDKTIVAIPADQIGVMTIQRGGASYRLVAGENGWTFGDGSPIDSASVARLRDRFNPLSAQGASFATPEQADTLDFRAADRRITLERSAGDTLATLLFRETANDFFVKRADHPMVFVLASWKVNEITPVDSTLRPKAPPSN